MLSRPFGDLERQAGFACRESMLAVTAYSEPSSSPIPYRVVYWERVRNQLRSHISTARDLGLGPRVLAALKELDHRLHLYPQFGQPLLDLELQAA
jgi:hypothetical protein